MLTNKQSFILCVFVAFGFAISGMLQILDNFVVIAILCLAFIAVVINIFSNKQFIDESFTESHSGEDEEE